MAVRNPNTLNPIVNRIRNTITTIENKEGKVFLYWVKSHSKILGNERADELAKAAALQTKARIEYEEIPLSFIKRTIRDDTINRWQHLVDNADTARTTRRFFTNVKMAHKVMTKIGDMNNTLAQLLTGHGGFRSYLHRFRLSPTPDCICDDVSPETVEHILTECPIYDYRRWETEIEMGCAVREELFPEIIEDDNRRRIFLRFALWAVRTAHRRNGGRSLPRIS